MSYSFFWEYISFFMYFFIKSYIFHFHLFLNYSVLKFLQLFKFYQRFYYQSIHQLFLLFFELLFLKRFEVHLWLIDYHDQDVSGCIYCLSFCLYFTNTFAHIFSERQKSIAFCKYSISRLN